MNSSEKFLQLRNIFEEIHTECQVNGKCPSDEQFRSKLRNARIEIRGLRYSRGEYLLPGKEINQPYILDKTGDEYFHVLYIPVTDIGYYASGGKDVKLVLWLWSDGSRSKILK